MSERPLVVVTDHLAEAGVERPVLESVANVRLLQTSDENEVVRRGPTPTFCWSITTSS